MATPPYPRKSPGTSISQLSKHEIYWRDRYDWLKECGYELRPRFRPGWTPSWQTDSNRLASLSEDGWSLMSGAIIDAVRIQDKTQVSLKKIDNTVHSEEVGIAKYFAELNPSAANHCVPILEFLHPPNEPTITIIVMPLLRAYDSPRFDTFGEAVEFFRQMFEGLQFMHQHGIAHRDCNSNNIMMDATPMYPHGFHPDMLHQYRKRDVRYGDYSHAKHYTRTQRPVKYYFIDFGLSRRYTSEQIAAGPLWEDIILGGDKSPPEHQDERQIQADPFATDIYYLGNLIRWEFIEGWPGRPIYGRRGFEFMKPLVDDMVQDDPTKRPKIDEVVQRFAEIQKGLGWWKLRSRVLGKREFKYIPTRIVAHWTRFLFSTFSFAPAVPTPPC
uniref:Protein kinase domain-containing protein n=1 Tax=Mycena chlorophos TaxID=658473 RepID=A0ABQ0M737_MYCCL|nr:predicted protein [Mycena chlorophos]